MSNWYEAHVATRVAQSRYKWIHAQLTSKTRKGKVDQEILDKIEEWMED